MDKKLRLIESYNKKAKKWGYEELSLKDGKVIGNFTPKNIDSKSFIMKIIILFQNGYMEEDYMKITKS